MIEKFKDNTALLIAAIVVVGIALWFFLDLTMEMVLGLFGLGGAAVANKQLKASKNKAVAQEHMDLAAHAADKAVEVGKEADANDKNIQDIADDITEPKEPVEAGRKRKHFSAN